ncbi:hypothetical protein Ocin01_14811 [Orchesella cincta]|uniref:Chitin-binding type-4 domain-containing protein n=1 Tax=Orchesella cincta TaxID=48709 RepID=A0A1D2MFY1_ORCCI|nr:hypothetical protein Ocin01_14811 [Orchesella cincta]
MAFRRGIFLAIVVIITSEMSIHPVNSHGRVLDPLNRSSLWRCKEFDHLEPPKNWNDMELFCGGRLQQYEVNDGKCGVCGDPFDEPVPRANEDGGELYRGIIVRAYRSGAVIPVEVELTTSHKGWFEFKLCSKEDTASHLDQACFDEHPLELADGSGTNSKVPLKEEEGKILLCGYNLTLPKEVTCEHCVIQWHYETGNSWGIARTVWSVGMWTT